VLVRSAGISTWPNIIVAEERRPARAVRCTASQSSVVVFLGAMISRTRSTRISAPAPGRLPRAAIQVGEHLRDRAFVELGEVLDLGGRRARAR
jgi:hypothetical protein